MIDVKKEISFEERKFVWENEEEQAPSLNFAELMYISTKDIVPRYIYRLPIRKLMVWINGNYTAHDKELEDD